MSTFSSFIMPQHEDHEYVPDDSPPSLSPGSSSDSSTDSNSSQSSYETQLTNISVETFVQSDHGSQNDHVPRPLQKASTFPPLSRDSEYSNLKPAQWVQAQAHQNPRRTATAPTHTPPSLVRSTDKKDQFVNNLVDSATYMVEVIWPLAACDRHNLSLRTYIQEILKRTKTSFSTLQVALFYLLLIKAHVPMLDFTREQPRDMATIRGFQCGRRMFLAAIILASKYLQDRNYSSKAWSKITSLPVEEINANEAAFLNVIGWRLHIPESKFEKWQKILIEYSQPSFAARWKHAVRVLRPELDNLPPLSIFPRPISIDTSVPPISSYPSPLISSPAVFMGPASPTVSPHRINSPPTFASPSMRLPPFAPRLENLATPRFPEPLTPVSQTPAVSFANGRPRAMRSAFSLANSACLARSVRDCGGAVAASRPLGIFSGAFVPPVRCQSSASSPESMISDGSSLASRSSSISSASSVSSLGGSADANVYRLAHVAQLNSLKANMNFVLSSAVTRSAVTRSPEDVIIEECSRSPSPAAFDAAAASRKRARADLDALPLPFDQVEAPLQLKTRSLLRASTAQKPSLDQPMTRAPYAAVEAHDSFVKLAALQDCLPPQKRFRADGECAAETWRPTGGPGMWRNILY